jgi:hypothetical protein
MVLGCGAGSCFEQDQLDQEQSSTQQVAAPARDRIGVDDGITWHLR